MGTVSQLISLIDNLLDKQFFWIIKFFPVSLHSPHTHSHIGKRPPHDSSRPQKLVEKMFPFNV